MNRKHLQIIYHGANVNVNSMDENVFEINGGITINVDVSVKNFIHVKNIIFGILLMKKMQSVKQKISVFYLSFY